MEQQVFYQLSIEQLPFSANGITYIIGINRISASIFNDIHKKLVA